MSSSSGAPAPVNMPYFVRRWPWALTVRKIYALSKPNNKPVQDRASANGMWLIMVTHVSVV